MKEETSAAGRAIRDRLKQLGMTEPDLIRQAPIDADTLASLRRGQRKPVAKTRQKLDRALNWPDGTLDRILRGEIDPEAVATIEREVIVGQTDDSSGNRITLSIDVPLDVWSKMSQLEREEAIHLASAAVLRRMGEIEEGEAKPQPD